MPCVIVSFIGMSLMCLTAKFEVKIVTHDLFTLLNVVLRIHFGHNFVNFKNISKYFEKKIDFRGPICLMHNFHKKKTNKMLLSVSLYTLHKMWRHVCVHYKYNGSLHRNYRYILVDFELILWHLSLYFEINENLSLLTFDWWEHNKFCRNYGQLSDIILLIICTTGFKLSF